MAVRKEEERLAVAEAALVEDPDLAAYREAGFRHVKTGQELVLVYLRPDYERYRLEEDGAVRTLYVGQRYDARTLIAKGAPRRSDEPADLREWWEKVTGNPSSSPALKKTGDQKKG